MPFSRAFLGRRIEPVSRRTDILDRIIGHLYFRAQKAESRTEHELWSITLRLVSIAKRDEPSLDQASFLSVGRSFEGWRKGTEERAAMMAQELAMLVPDYDPQEARRAKLEQAGEVRRPEPFSGNLYAMPQEERPQESQPVRKVPRKAEKAVG